jgi:phenylacetate-CoA ligase
MSLSGLHIALVGPLPPPSGGMANQTRQLGELLAAGGAVVTVVPVNAPYWPAWVARVLLLRALLRLMPYLAALWRVMGHVDLVHVMANSGWSWHLFAAPAIWIAHWRGIPVVVNYRGGEAENFLRRSARLVRFTVRRSSALLVPSGFLLEVFARFGMPAEIVPNIVDLDRFPPREAARADSAHLLVARNLEPLYDNETAIRAFALVREDFPGARLTIAGSGPLEQQLRGFVLEQGLGDVVSFAGRLERDAMAAMYRSADLVLNPSLADNMPNSILEAWSSGVPVVSTNVGGIPYLAQDGVNASLVAPGDPVAMARACILLLSDPATWRQRAQAGLQEARRYTWLSVRPVLQDVYRRAMHRPLPGSLGGQTSLYTSIVSTLLFPIHERLKRHDSPSLLRDMESVQWLPAERIAELQLQSLRGFLQDVAVHVPYYRDLFVQAGFDPAGVGSLTDLQRLPFLTKSVIRANVEGLKHSQADGLARFNTGGSSGEPLVFFIGKRRVSHDVAAKWRATRWWGVDIGDPEIVVWGSPIELGKQDRIKYWRDKMLRTRLLPAFEMSESKLDQFVATIRAVKPRMLFGYPSALTHIARHAQKRQVPMTDLGIKVAFVTSERLYDDQRATIEQVFGCRVANGYGGRDAGFIAHECPAGGMHITADDMVVEIVDDEGQVQGAGVAGEIVVTHLRTNDFPFIRYRTGDIGVLGATPCSCGRGLPLLQDIQGRSTDFVVAADGTVMHGLSLIYVLRDLPGIQAFKVIQETRERTRVLLVVEPEFQSGAIAQIVSGFQQRLGTGVTVDVEWVDSIPAEKSGKFRYIVSHA